MLCSGKELGLGDDASGLLILSPETKIGAPIAELFPSDTIFDVEIIPNRGDLLSHFGLAREIAALAGRPLRLSRSGGTGGAPALQLDGVAIVATRECPFFSLRRIENVKVAPSPHWLRSRIESVGIRSINNIVDISNFVMLELGQPTHAFDAAKLHGGVNVRLARKDEKFIALDGKTYSLSDTNLVVADARRAVGIAGVMGGEESGVSESTTTVLLESAYFLPSNIRRTARDLNLPSDASYRFERGVDPQMILPSSQRVTELICETAGGKAANEVDVAGQLPLNPSDVKLHYEKLDTLLGAHIEPATADEKLKRFGLEKEPSTITSRSTKWRIPSYRRDLQREVDLIEEVVRAYGVEKIPNANRSHFTPSSDADRSYDFENQLRRDLVALGLNESRTPALIARSELAKTEGAIALRNPLSEDHVALRTSLIPGLLGALKRNVRAGSGRIALFELGNIFAALAGEQKRMLAIVLNGPVSSRKNWRGEKGRQFDFFDLKGIINALSPAAGYESKRTEMDSFALAAEIFVGEKRVGMCGQLSSAEASELDATDAVLLAEIDVAEIAQVRRSGARFSEIERYPSVRRDIAMFVGAEVSHEKIVGVIAAAKEPLLERVELFDLFSEKTSGARKSLAYSLTYRDKNRTLTNDEVSAVHARIRERLQTEIDAELRE
jgi:phenylalanyl-tRNA synthetase beta chain